MSGFKTNMVNKGAAPKGTSLNYRQKPTTTSRVLHNVKKGKFAARTTGDYFDMPDGRWWRILMNNSSFTEAYVRQDVTLFVTPKTNPNITEAQAQQLINDLVKSDIAVFDNLLISGNILKKLDTAGKNVDSYKKIYDELTTRHSYRQKKIKESKLLKWKTGLKKWQSKALSLLKNWEISYNKPKMPSLIKGIGSISVTAIVIGAVIGVGLTVAIYFAFRPTYTESQTDLKLSTDLQKALQNLSPEAAQAVKNDLEKQIDDAYNYGQRQGTFSGAGKIIKPLVIGVLAYWGVTKFLESQKNKA